MTDITITTEFIKLQDLLKRSEEHTSELQSPS